MKSAPIEMSKAFFRGVLRTSRGSVILTAIEKMPIAPESLRGFAANRAYGRRAEPQERGAGVGQRIWVGQLCGAY
jgi:hypothetical protein